MTQIEIEQLSKIYAEQRKAFKALDSVSLRIEPGEFFFLLGPSGCGKTTLLRAIAGLLEPTSGRILFNGEDITHKPVEQRKTAMVFQNYALWPHMTIRQNVEFGPKMRKAPAAVRKELVDSCLEKVSMSDYARRKPNQLSGGQQQRVALARALAARPDCLLLDEPLSNLDAALRQRMRLELHRMIKEQGVTAVYVTHDQTEALSMADRIAVLRQGVIEQVGTPGQIYFEPVSRFVAEFVGEANFIEGRLDDPANRPVVETAAGPLRVLTGKSFKSSGVVCCIRPEHMRLALPEETAKSDAVNSLPAQVQSFVFQGDTTRVNVRLSNGLEWKLTQISHFNRFNIKAGQSVSIIIDPASIILLDK